MKQEARTQNRTVFQVSSLMAMSAITHVTEKARWLSASAKSAARKTGVAVGGRLLEDYRATLSQIRKTGYVRCRSPSSGRTSAAVSRFTPASLTEILLANAASARRIDPKTRPGWTVYAGSVLGLSRRIGK
jgi:hypothetical protein